MALIETALQLGSVPLPASSCCHKHELAVWIPAPVLLQARPSCSSPQGAVLAEQPGVGVEAGESTGMVLSIHSNSVQALAFVPALQLVYARNLWHV